MNDVTPDEQISDETVFLKKGVGSVATPIDQQAHLQQVDRELSLPYQGRDYGRWMK
jgi:hypothetical protein